MPSRTSACARCGRRAARARRRALPDPPRGPHRSRGKADLARSGGPLCPGPNSSAQKGRIDLMSASTSLASARVTFAPVEGAARVFTPDFLDYVVRLHDELGPRARTLLVERAAVLRRALDGAPLESLFPAPPSTDDWRVPAVPADLSKPGIEISGPCSITSMFINALNPGPEGERAEGDLDDDEDSAGHRLVDTVRAALNRHAAVNGELAYDDTERNRRYRIAPGDIPFFMHRERGLHLDEPEFLVDGRPINAAILGTALTFYYVGRAQVTRGQGIFFYLPKLRSPAECAWYRDLFDRSRAALPFLRDAVISAIPLVESLPAVYQMDEDRKSVV